MKLFLRHSPPLFFNVEINMPETIRVLRRETIMAMYTYYKPGEYGADSSMVRDCPYCGSRCYSSHSLNNQTYEAACPYCGREF